MLLPVLVGGNGGNASADAIQVKGKKQEYTQWLQHDPITFTDSSLPASAMLLPVAVGGNGGNAAPDTIQQECE